MESLPHRWLSSLQQQGEKDNALKSNEKAQSHRYSQNASFDYDQQLLLDSKRGHHFHNRRVLDSSVLQSQHRIDIPPPVAATTAQTALRRQRLALLSELRGSIENKPIFELNRSRNSSVRQPSRLESLEKRKEQSTLGEDSFMRYPPPPASKFTQPEVARKERGRTLRYVSIQSDGLNSRRASEIPTLASENSVDLSNFKIGPKMEEGRQFKLRPAGRINPAPSRTSTQSISVLSEISGNITNIKFSKRYEGSDTLTQASRNARSRQSSFSKPQSTERKGSPVKVKGKMSEDQVLMIVSVLNNNRTLQFQVIRKSTMKKAMTNAEIISRGQLYQTSIRLAFIKYFRYWKANLLNTSLSSEVQCGVTEESTTRNIVRARVYGRFARGLLKIVEGEEELLKNSPNPEWVYEQISETIVFCEEIETYLLQIQRITLLRSRLESELSLPPLYTVGRQIHSSNIAVIERVCEELSHTCVSCEINVEIVEEVVPIIVAHTKLRKNNYSLAVSKIIQLLEANQSKGKEILNDLKSFLREFERYELLHYSLKRPYSQCQPSKSELQSYRKQLEEFHFNQISFNSAITKNLKLINLTTTKETLIVLAELLNGATERAKAMESLEDQSERETQISVISHSNQSTDCSSEDNFQGGHSFYSKEKGQINQLNEVSTTITSLFRSLIALSQQFSASTLACPQESRTVALSKTTIELSSASQVSTFIGIITQIKEINDKFDATLSQITRSQSKQTLFILNEQSRTGRLLGAIITIAGQMLELCLPLEIFSSSLINDQISEPFIEHPINDLLPSVQQLLHHNILVEEILALLTDFPFLRHFSLVSRFSSAADQIAQISGDLLEYSLQHNNLQLDPLIDIYLDEPLMVRQFKTNLLVRRAFFNACFTETDKLLSLLISQYNKNYSTSQTNFSSSSLQSAIAQFKAKSIDNANNLFCQQQKVLKDRINDIAKFFEDRADFVNNIFGDLKASRTLPSGYLVQHIVDSVFEIIAVDLEEQEHTRLVTQLQQLSKFLSHATKNLQEEAGTIRSFLIPSNTCTLTQIPSSNPREAFISIINDSINCIIASSTVLQHSCSNAAAILSQMEFTMEIKEAIYEDILKASVVYLQSKGDSMNIIQSINSNKVRRFVLQSTSNYISSESLCQAVLELEVDAPTWEFEVIISTKTQPSQRLLRLPLQRRKQQITVNLPDVYADLQLSLLSTEPDGFVRHQSDHNFFMQADKSTKLNIADLHYNLRNREQFKIFYERQEKNSLNPPNEVAAVTNLSNIFKCPANSSLITSKYCSPYTQEWTIEADQTVESFKTIDFYAKLQTIDQGVFKIYDSKQVYTVYSNALLKRYENYEGTTSIAEELVNNCWHAFSIIDCKIFQEQQLITSHPAIG